MGKISKYQLVMDWIHEQIDTGVLHNGEKLETEAQLSARFGFSRQTIRQALGELEKDGTISRVQGSGSYVRGNPAGETAAPLSRSVTILSSYTDSYIFPQILQAMVEVLQEEGYSTRILFTNNRRQTEKEILTNLLRSASRDPIIAEPVTSALPNLNAPLYRELLCRGIPVLFFNTWYPELDIPHVSLDDRAAGRMVTEHLISLGHRRIGCLMKNDDGQGILRYRGYMEALSDAGIGLDESIVCWIDSTGLKHSLNPCEWVLNRLQDCTGIVCYNDEAAYLLTQACARRKIKVPDQLSLVSIDNSRLTQLNQVPLTSAAHPMGKLGEKAARNLLEMIRHPGFDANYEFAPSLEVRSSAARVP
jgi:GntR family transcriptional regulator of arabinose operon